MSNVGSFQLFWGDLHRQSGLTCGEGTMEEHFTTCRDYHGLSFAAITDNAVLTESPKLRLFPSKKLQKVPHFARSKELHSVSRENWKILQRLVKKYNEPGRFVTFLGYEWCSTRYGDRNVYFLEDSAEMQLQNEVEALWEALEKYDALLVTHHSGYALGRRGVDWNYHNPRLERLVEIYSTEHGCSESDAACFRPVFRPAMGGLVRGGDVQSALLRRYKLGIICGSDSHHLKQPPAKAGIYATELTRRALWEALFNRRTIGTTEARISIAFWMDDHFIGEIFSTDRMPVIRIEVSGPHRIDCVQVIRSGEVVRQWHPCTERWKVRYREDREPKRPDEYYYVRVQDCQGNVAWTSPIWVSYLPDTPFARGYLYWLPEERVLFMGGVSGRKVTLTCWNTGREAVTDLTVTALDRSGSPLELRKCKKLGAGGKIKVEFNLPRGWKQPTYRLSYKDTNLNTRSVDRHELPEL